MFSKGSKEDQSAKPNDNPNPKVSDFTIPNQKINNPNPQKMPSSPLTTNQVELEQPQLVKLVEKISGILSPYFIVIVGLYLYDNNFLFGSLLILIGILSLLKVSYQDILGWIEQIKSFFTDNNKNNPLQ